jgi:signal transduction histidine kinase
MSPLDRIALLGVADVEFARRLVGEILRSGKVCQLPVASNLEQLQAKLARVSPQVILLDESAVGDTYLEEAARQFTVAAPVIVVASPERQKRMAHLVALGEVEFVAREGDFVQLAAGLIERRLRWAEDAESSLRPPWSVLPEDFAEILRHEINNPLTGILGNAELVLAQRDKLSAPMIQRLETVVELAVRLREVIRRLTQTCESEERHARAS